jgi:hypothetical protein
MILIVEPSHLGSDVGACLSIAIAELETHQPQVHSLLVTKSELTRSRGEPICKRSNSTVVCNGGGVKLQQNSFVRAGCPAPCRADVVFRFWSTLQNDRSHPVMAPGYTAAVCLCFGIRCSHCSSAYQLPAHQQSHPPNFKLKNLYSRPGPPSPLSSFDPPHFNNLQRISRSREIAAAAFLHKRRYRYPVVRVHLNYSSCGYRVILALPRFAQFYISIIPELGPKAR